MVCSFLPGSDIFHKIAVLNKELRGDLPKSGLLDQERELSLRVHSKRQGSRTAQSKDFIYGFRLATVINFDSLRNHKNDERALDPINVLY